MLRKGESNFSWWGLVSLIHCLVIIRLSRPLLQLRPFSDTIDTLLHEMIHAYQFLHAGRRAVLDRDGHGDDFCVLMERINRREGSHITVYHSFHDEVNHLQKHVWRCTVWAANRHSLLFLRRDRVGRGRRTLDGLGGRWIGSLSLLIPGGLRMRPVVMVNLLKYLVTQLKSWLVKRDHSTHLEKNQKHQHKHKNKQKPKRKRRNHSFQHPKFILVSIVNHSEHPI